MKFYQKNVSRVKHGNIKKQLPLWVTMIGKHNICVQSITQEVQELWKLSTCRKCLVDLSTYTVYDIPFTMAQQHSAAGLFRKNYRKKHLRRHVKNYCYFCKSNIPVISLILDSRNMIKLSKNTSL